MLKFKMKERRIFLIILVLILSAPFHLISKKFFPVSISLRVDPEISKTLSITREKLNLIVNKKITEIISIKKEERSIAQKSLLGKNFVLSTGNFTEYNKKLAKGVSYLVTEILTPEDSLLLVAGNNVHQIKITKNKEKIINRIAEILSSFFKARTKQQKRVSKGINSELARLKSYYENYDPANRMLGEGLLYFETLTRLATEINFYKRNFISPTKKSAETVLDLIGLREGDRFWIHIQNKNIYPFSKRLQYILKKIRYNMAMTTLAESSWQKVVSSKLHTLEQSLMISDSYPSRSLSKIFIRANITFFASLVESNFKLEGIFSRVVADLENNIEYITRRSGGKSEIADDSESAIRKFISHPDSYYILTFNTDLTPKKLDISLGNENPGKYIFYRKKIEVEEFLKIYRNFSAGSIKIALFKLKNGILSFKVSSYSKNREKKIGLIKAVLEILNSEKNTVYKNSNILRAVKKDIHVDIRVPKLLRKGFLVRLSLLDMISNRLVKKEIVYKN